MSWALAAGISAAIAIAAALARGLTASGAVAAAAVGTLILSSTGWAGCAVLGVFFGGTMLVDRIAGAARNIDPSAATRDWIQVIANGGPAAAGAVAERAVPGLGLWLVTITLAAAAADTWATAFGALSSRPPRDILRRTVVEPGTSGGVTLFGTAGGLMGAALVALAGSAVGGRAGLYGAALGLGFLGMIADSVLGSGVQARFRCLPCNEITERRLHRCGARTDLARGWAWMDNSAVNLVATTLVGFAGLAAWYAWR